MTRPGGQAAPERRGGVRRARRRARPGGCSLLVVAARRRRHCVLWLGVRPPAGRRRIGLRIPWWVLALMFAATEIWVFHIQVGREAQSISAQRDPARPRRSSTPSPRTSSSPASSGLRW